MHINKFFVAALVAALFVPMSVSAQGPSYNYVDLSYTDFDPGKLASIDGSFAINESFHFVAGFGRASGDVNLWTVGVGFNHPLSDVVDFVGRLGLGRASGGGSTAKLAQVGLRGMLTEMFELNGFANYAQNGTSDTSFELGGVYSFTEQFGALLSINDDSDITVGLRYSF